MFSLSNWGYFTGAATSSAYQQCRSIALSDTCDNQGYIYDKWVVALHFHLETTHDGAISLVDNCANERGASRYVQSADVYLFNRA